MSEPLVLASSSPRRRRLFEQAGLVAEIAPAEIDERARADEPALDYARRMASAKAALTARARQGALVLGADTVVHQGDTIFHKPDGEQGARDMLRALSDQWHEVTSAFALYREQEQLALEHVTTRVRFRALTAEEIGRYVASGEALDKAGAYGIQGLGGALVDRVEGSYTNVVGLPLQEVLSCLRAFGVEPS